jgi:hypothetical protein
MPQRASVFCNFYIRVDREALVSERALNVGSVASKAMSTKIYIMQNLLDDKWWSSNFSVPKLRNWMQIAFLHIIKMFPKHGLFSQNQAFIRSCTKMHLIALFIVIL